jgi:uncharacterized membrane protein YcaP (DUF421 family)
VDIALRGIALFAFVYLLTRVIGRRELTSLQPFDPIVLVEDGRVIERNLRRERLTVEDLAKQARSHELASLADVQWAISEPSGSISFIPKQ